MKDKLCPFKFRYVNLEFGAHGLLEGSGKGYVSCEGEYCACWEGQTGTCGFVTAAYLQGVEAADREMRDERDASAWARREKEKT